MTEAEWLACGEPERLLEFARGWLSDRAARLFAVACCRRAWHLLADPRSRDAVARAEEAAEGLRMPWSLEAAEADAERAVLELPYGDDPEWMTPEGQAAFWAARAAHAAVNLWAYTAAVNAARYSADALEAIDVSFCHPAFRSPARSAQCAWVRCLTPGPFRTPRFEPAWRTANARDLARTAYEEEAFDRLPVLADALEDAGATGDILAHLRGPGPHVRGCWALDLVLGKV